MFENLQARIIKKLEFIGLASFSFDRDANRKIILTIEKKLFYPGELKDDGFSSFSILARRTVAQFLGTQYWNLSVVNIWIRHLICLAILPFYLFTFLLKGSIKPKKPFAGSGQVEIVLVSAIKGKLHYEPFKDIYPDRSIVVPGNDFQLTFKDIKFILKVLRTCKKLIMYPELLWRVMRRIAQYSAIIHSIKCNIIVNMSSEGSPWSSILTAYCRENRIKHVSIMHGIRLYSSPMAFPEFDIFYVWGKYHLEQFNKMHVSAREFIIYGNPIHRKLYKEISNFPIKYMKQRLLILFDYPIMTLDNNFVLLCELLQQVGLDWELAFRPHPRYVEESFSFAKKKLENIIQGEILMEHPDKLSIGESIRKAGAVASCYSNALSDAWIAGKKCIYIHTSRVPLQEYHQSINIKVYHSGDDISEFLKTPVIRDEHELTLKNRFSYNFENYLNKRPIVIARHNFG